MPDWILSCLTNIIGLILLITLTYFLGWFIAAALGLGNI